MTDLTPPTTSQAQRRHLVELHPASAPGTRFGGGRVGYCPPPVDWYVDAADTAALSDLRREIGAYLARHAEPGSDVAGAELAASELLSNVPLHAPGPAWISLTWTDEFPVLEVRDLGPGFTPDVIGLPETASVTGRGLFVVSALVPSLEIQSRRAGGTLTRAVLNVRRAPSPSYDPAPSPGTLLPSLSEARPEGAFGKEAFLRALVVQLAQTLEGMGGPAFADAAVAQVGIDVGHQMDAEYRAATQVVGALSPKQLADCFVRLKHAIDGEFFVMEMNDERIVLGNHACPFGDEVRHAPALCRMTSAVFGGIAAKSHGEVAVTLEERIAVGDPGCRVVIDLRPNENTGSPATHRYRRPGMVTEQPDG